MKKDNYEKYKLVINHFTFVMFGVIAILMYLYLIPIFQSSYANGVYNVNTKEIKIFPKNLNQLNLIYEYKFTVFHELGHYVWFEFFTDDEKDYYCNNIFANSNYYNAYIKIHNNFNNACEEYFADKFSKHIINDEFKSDYIIENVINKISG